MKIGHYVPYVANRKGYERNVSGHVQSPLRGIQALRDAGHEVHLITNPIPEGYTLPHCMPDGVPLHFVEDARVRKTIYEKDSEQKSGIKATRLWRQAVQIRGTANRLGLDVMHFHGFNRVAYLAGGLSMLGMRAPAVLTIMGANFPESAPAWMTRPLWRRIGAIVTATDYVRDRCREHGIEARVVRHGVIRDLKAEHGAAPIGPRCRILFWRDPSPENGADLVMRAYEELAPKHPDVIFTMAVRPSFHEVEGLDALAERHSNVEVHRFPYPEGVTLPRLVLESFCVVMPMREMSIDPQLVVAETMAAGVPVIATRQRSNPELIEDGVNGALVPVGDYAATRDAVERMARDPGAAMVMGRRAAASIASRWNWDEYASEMTRVYEGVAKRRVSARA